MKRNGLELDAEAIERFCLKWRIRELDIFGSILREDFHPESDVDFLFVLEDGVALTIETWMAMEEGLQAIVGRKVDLVPRKDVESSPNYIRRKHILSTAEPLFVAR